MKRKLTKREKDYLDLSEPLKELYSSEKTNSLNAKLINQYQIPDDKIDVFLNVTGDVILGYNKTTDLPRLFQSELGMSADDSQRLTSSLIEFLSPVIKREEEGINIKKEEIDKLAKTFATAIQEQEKEIQTKGSEADVKPLRTMESDANRVHGYGAYRAQEAEAKQNNLVTAHSTASESETDASKTEDKPIIATSQTDLLSKAPVPAYNSETKPAPAPIVPNRTASDFLSENKLPKTTPQPTQTTTHEANQIPVKKVE